MEKIRLVKFMLYTKYQYFSSILCKSPNLFLIELIIKLKRWFYSDGNVTDVQDDIDILLVARTRTKRFNKRNSTHLFSMFSTICHTIFTTLASFSSIYFNSDKMFWCHCYIEIAHFYGCSMLLLLSKFLLLHFEVFDKR